MLTLKKVQLEIYNLRLHFRYLNQIHIHCHGEN